MPPRYILLTKLTDQHHGVFNTTLAIFFFDAFNFELQYFQDSDPDSKQDNGSLDKERIPYRILSVNRQFP